MIKDLRYSCPACLSSEPHAQTVAQENVDEVLAAVASAPWPPPLQLHDGVFDIKITLKQLLTEQPPCASLVRMAWACIADAATQQGEGR